ncbi:MAG TPA: sigma-70 family RNA polymerase sigma factor, partial [Gemmatimonadales bacterium]|nr:sigma-70 family RNA polymerase sigma factor [Gemmatimonadales bacterium]
MSGTAVADGLSTAQLEAARLGFAQVLRRKGMSREFVAREGEDLLAQAFFEYSRHLARGEVIRDPVAWILVCAWHRTVSLLEARDRRPRLVSTDRLAELPAAGVEGSPEEEFLTEDRLRKVRDAVDRLPGYQRRLLALSYFEGESVREAARRLGWTPSKAQRAHETARRRLHRHLGVEASDELTVVGLAAFLSLGLRTRPIPRLVGGVEGVLDSVADHASHLAERSDAVARHPFGGEGPAHLA